MGRAPDGRHWQRTRHLRDTAAKKVQPEPNRTETTGQIQTKSTETTSPDYTKMSVTNGEEMDEELLLMEGNEDN